MAGKEGNPRSFKQLKNLSRVAASLLLVTSVAYPATIQFADQDKGFSAILAGFNPNCQPQIDQEITAKQGPVIDFGSPREQHESLAHCLTKKEIRHLNKVRTAAFVYFTSKNPDHDGSWKWWNDNIPAGVSIYDRWNSHYLPDIDPSKFDPREELVSGQDPEYIRYVLKKLSDAHIDYAVESWWGIGHESDAAFDMSQDILESKDSPAPDLKVAAYVEISAYEPNLSELERQVILDHLWLKAQRPSYMYVDEKPMLKFYTLDDSWFTRPANQWVRQAQARGFYVDMRVYNHGLYVLDDQPDARHLYRSDVREAMVDRSLMISPGFFLATDKHPRLAEDPDAFKESLLRGLTLAARGKLDELLFVALEPVEGVGFLPKTLTKIHKGKQVEDPNGLPSFTMYNIVKSGLELIPRNRSGHTIAVS